MILVELVSLFEPHQPHLARSSVLGQEVMPSEAINDSDTQPASLPANYCHIRMVLLSPISFQLTLLPPNLTVLHVSCPNRVHSCETRTPTIATDPVSAADTYITSPQHGLPRETEYGMCQLQETENQSRCSSRLLPRRTDGEAGLYSHEYQGKK